MDWPEALEIIVARTGHAAFRKKCRDDNPHVAERDAFRRRMIAMATGVAIEPAPPGPTPAAPPRPYPPLRRRVANAAGAVGRVVRALATGDRVFASDEEKARRRAICDECPFFDRAARRCAKCGCIGRLKTLLETEAGQCPDDPPRW